jgi:cytoskeleton protein RodZ
MNESTFPGSELRARREVLGYSVDDVYRRIRVPIDVIQSLETGDVHKLPSACYTVGFLKTYCQFLEIGPNRFVDTYQACVRPTARFLRRATPAKDVPHPKWVGELIAWSAVCLVIGLGWFAYAVVVRPNADPGEHRAFAGTQEDLHVPETVLGE